MQPPMMINISVWELITTGVSLLLGMFGIVKLLLNQFVSRIDARFAKAEKEAEEWRRFEREFMEFKSNLPIDYVRREDFVRNQTIIEAKLDALALRLENYTLKGRQP